MNTPVHVGVHLGDAHLDFTAVLVVSAVATATLCALGASAYRQRRSRAYLLILLALTALVARPLLGGLAMTGVVSPTAHHTLEHGSDAVIGLLVVAAAYYARSVEPTTGGER